MAVRPMQSADMFLLALACAVGSSFAVPFPPLLPPGLSPASLATSANPPFTPAVRTSLLLPLDPPEQFQDAPELQPMVLVTDVGANATEISGIDSTSWQEGSNSTSDSTSKPGKESSRVLRTNASATAAAAVTSTPASDTPAKAALQPNVAAMAGRPNQAASGNGPSSSEKPTPRASAGRVPPALPLTTTEFPAEEDYPAIQVGTRCDAGSESTGLQWNQTEGGLVATAPCPGGYQGAVYRPCYSSGLWGTSDYTDCRLERLANIRNLIYYHLHNNLIEGLYHLADDLARYLATVDMKSPMDRLDTMDTLNSILQTKVTLKLRNGFDIAFVQSLLESVNEILTRKNVEFTSESRKISLMTAKTGEMVLSLSTFVDTALNGFRQSDLKEVALSASENIALNLRRKLKKEQPVLVYTNESEITTVKLEDDYPSGSVRAVLVLRGLGSLLNNDIILLNSDLLIVAFLPPLKGATGNLTSFFDVTMNYKQESKLSTTALECGSVWNSTWLWSRENCRLVSQSGRTATCRCQQSGNVAALLHKNWLKEKSIPPPRVSIVMLGGCVICLGAVVLTFVVYVCNLRKDISESSIIKMNLLISVAFIQIVYIAGVQATSIREVCYSVAIVLHYLFLVASFWMLSYGIHLYRRLRSSAALAPSVPPSARLLRPRTRDYCLLSWALPGALVVLSFVVNPRGYEIRRYCWLSIQRGMLLSFIVPISILIVVNTTLMVLVLRCFFAQRPVTHKTDIDKIRCSLRAGVVLLPLLAVNWFFGVLSLENTSTAIFEGVFACTNSLLGIFIFVFYCAANPEIRYTWNLAGWIKTQSQKRPKSGAIKLKKSSTFSSHGRQSCTVSPTDDAARSDVQPLLFASAAPSEDLPSSSSTTFLRV